jgi:hypothetical protein
MEPRRRFKVYFVLIICLCVVASIPIGPWSVKAQLIGDVQWYLGATELCQLAPQTPGCNSGITTPPNLSGKNLSGKNLSNAVLAGANMSGTILMGTNLTNAILCGATLNNANMTIACLKGANLMGANLSGAVLIGAILDGAIWTDGSTCKAGSVGTCKN